MEDDKYQEIVLKKLEKHDQLFEQLAQQMLKISEKLEHISSSQDKRFDNLEVLLKQHHEETEKIARQVERLVTEQDDLASYFLKRREINNRQHTKTTT